MILILGPWTFTIKFIFQNKNSNKSQMFTMFYIFSRNDVSDKSIRKKLTRLFKMRIKVHFLIQNSPGEKILYFAGTPVFFLSYTKVYESIYI